MKNIRILYLKIFHFLVVKFSVHLNRHVFVMCIKTLGMPRLICHLAGRTHPKIRFLTLRFTCFIPENQRVLKPRREYLQLTYVTSNYWLSQRKPGAMLVHKICSIQCILHISTLMALKSKPFFFRMETESFWRNCRFSHTHAYEIKKFLCVLVCGKIDPLLYTHHENMPILFWPP